MDRSSTIRMLLREGYSNHMKKKAVQSYREGRLTLGKAAQKAGLTIWEMKEHLTGKGYVSGYNISDLEEEVKLLAKKY